MMRGVSMLEKVSLENADLGDFVQFSETGARASGAFRCASCGYGVTVQVALPRCPMCAGTTWEASPATSRSPIVRQLL
jgi:rubredoxin